MFNRKQFSILSERYLDTLLGDLSSLLWMIGQAPLIAALIILRWKGIQATETLYFVMALSAVWFGAINGCREIAREKMIVKRESLFGLNMGAYLASKVKILGFLGLIEMVLFFFILNHFLVLDLILLPAFGVIYLLYCSGMALGLLLSGVTGNVSKAVVSVPIVIIPQIVFSKFVLPAQTLKGASEKLERLMVVRWGFEALNSSKRAAFMAEPFIKSLIVLAVLTIVFLLITYLFLWFTKDEI